MYQGRLKGSKGILGGLWGESGGPKGFQWDSRVLKKCYKDSGGDRYVLGGPRGFHGVSRVSLVFQGVLGSFKKFKGVSGPLQRVPSRDGNTH